MDRLMPSVLRPQNRKLAPARVLAIGRETIETTVAAAYSVPFGEMQTRSRGRAPVALARQVAMYLAHVALGLNYSATGRLFDRDRTTVAHACRIVEDRRDDPYTDDLLCALEFALGCFVHRVRI